MSGNVISKIERVQTVHADEQDAFNVAAIAIFVVVGCEGRERQGQQRGRQKIRAQASCQVHVLLLVEWGISSGTSLKARGWPQGERGIKGGLKECWKSNPTANSRLDRPVSHQ